MYPRIAYLEMSEKPLYIYPLKISLCKLCINVLDMGKHDYLSNYIQVVSISEYSTNEYLKEE